MDVLEASATKEKAPECCLGTLYEGKGQGDRMEGRDLLEVGGGKQRILLVQWLGF